MQHVIEKLDFDLGLYGNGFSETMYVLRVPPNKVVHVRIHDVGVFIAVFGEEEDTPQFIREYCQDLADEVTIGKVKFDEALDIAKHKGCDGIVRYTGSTLKEVFYVR